MNERKVAGVLGGLGPMATVYFYDIVVEMTDAKKDQDHIDMIIMNRATTPDRTEYIIGKSKENPAEVLIKDAQRLEKAGADFLVLTCNTGHYFYNEINESVKVPLISMIEETVKKAVSMGHKKMGILATTGNINTKLYQNMCEKYNLSYEICSEEKQKIVMSLIYDNVKAGIEADMKNFNSVITFMKEKGCDGVFLGCTELSIIKKDNKLSNEFYIDSSEVLAEVTIKKCGGELK